MKFCIWSIYKLQYSVHVHYGTGTVIFVFGLLLSSNITLCTVAVHVVMTATIVIHLVAECLSKVCMHVYLDSTGTQHTLL